MEPLFVFDAENYTMDMPLVRREGIRALIRRGNLWAMQYADGAEYKIPGGGKEGEESDLDTLTREVLEETGLTVKQDTARLVAEVVERRRDVFDATKRFEAWSRYYICEVEDGLVPTHLTPSEIAKGYHLQWADLDTVLAANESLEQEAWMRRDDRFLSWLRENPQIW